MSGFFYWFDGEAKTPGAIVNAESKKLDAARLADCRLDDVFRDCMTVPDKTLGYGCVGPTGNRGIILYPRLGHSEGIPPKTVYDPDNQVWLDRGSFQIGWTLNNFPTADDLRRPNMAGSGYQLKDDYNGAWLIPCFRSPRKRETVPVVYSLDNEFNLVKTIKQEYRSAWELAGEVIDYLKLCDGQTEGDVIEEKYPETWTFNVALSFLSVNYRIGPAETAAFAYANREILDARFIALVLQAAVEWQLIGEWTEYFESQKKTSESSPVAV